MPVTRGIHHVTAFAGDARPNRRFYEHVLGLRLIKRTVNYDDPGTHHLYYADGPGTPGTVVTFFPWPGAKPREAGGAHAGEIAAFAFAVPRGSLSAWTDRLRTHDVETSRSERFGDPLLTLHDPDGITIELI